MDTIQIFITDRTGKKHCVDAPTDMNLNLMEICKMYDLGVEGTCGGMALCASCQVYVKSSHNLPLQSESELDMLDAAFHVNATSRLGCQIKISSEIHNLEVEIAPK